MMRLRLTTPTELVLDEAVAKVVAEAENGHFCLLPRHVDFVAALVPGLLAYVPAAGPPRRAAGEGPSAGGEDPSAAGEDPSAAGDLAVPSTTGPHVAAVPGNGGEVYVAVDRGILVKCGADVRIATRRAVKGADLGMLRSKVIEEFEALDEVEIKTRSALARLESGFLRRFLEIGEIEGG